MLRTLPPYILQTLSWPPMRMMLSLGNFEVKGLEHIKNMHGPVIFASNHAGEIDPIMVPAAIPFFSALTPMFYVAKKREFYEKEGPMAFLYGGGFFKLWGAYPVREGLRDYRLSLSTHAEILRDGGNLLIFPEGGVTPDGEVKGAHGGVAYLAHVTKTPVVPVAICGTYKFSWKNFFQKRKITVAFGAPILPQTLFGAGSELTPEAYRAAAEKMMGEVKNLLNRHCSA